MRERKADTFFLSIHMIAFVVVSAAIILAVNIQQRNQALHEAAEKTRILLEHNLAIHTYFSKQLKPRIFDLTDKTRESSYFDPTWMSSTYAVREIDKYYRGNTGHSYYYKECAVNARSPENEADELEKAFIEGLKEDPSRTDQSLVRHLNGELFFVHMRRGESMEQSCLRCHSKPVAAPAGLVERYGAQRSFQRTTGELVSAISIRIPLGEAYKAANMFSLKLSLLLIVILGLTFTLQHFIIHRMFLQPLTSIRNRVMAVLGDEMKLGESVAPESVSSEVNDLTRAYNEMSLKLHKEREGLVAQVNLRTVELTEKVAELQSALAQVKRLEGIIPICGYCKQIRDDKESWHQLEAYISDHSDALFSHGICPECLEKEMAKV